MKIIQVHNHYRFRCGEDTVFENTIDLLTRKGHTVLSFSRSAAEIGDGWLGKTKAVVESIYSVSSANSIDALLDRVQPDVVEVHNIFPLISPSVLQRCHQAGVPVVMRCHNFRLLCPTGDFYSKGAVCERCSDGHEYWCVIRNCRENMLESVAYSLRSYASRVTQRLRRSVTLFIVLTEFAKNRLLRAGYPEDCVVVLPNMARIPNRATDARKGEYICYVGGFMKKKGISTLLSAAKRTGLPLRMAGDYNAMPGINHASLSNVEFVGHLSGASLDEFYRGARFLVIPSEWYEMFPMVILEAMGHGLPVIASRIGALSDIVEDGSTGLLFEAGNIEDLAEKMSCLWGDTRECGRLGQLGREKAIREYSEDRHYERLAAIYRKAIDIRKAESSL